MQRFLTKVREKEINMNRMKKILAMLLTMVLVFGCLAGCGEKVGDGEGASHGAEGEQQENTSAGESEENNQASNGKKFKIGVAEMIVTDESVTRQNYLTEYIAPHYNCEFTFSEELSDTDAAMTFIENCASAGCDAIISCYNTDTEQLLQKCQEYDMVFVQNIARTPRSEAMFTGGYDNFGGTFAEDQQAAGQLFLNYLLENIDTGEEHGFVVCTSLAYNGHLQSTEISTAMLHALEEVYGLTFTEDISTYLASSTPMYAENDKNIPVYIYPDLYNVDGYIQGLGAELQTGKYDYVLAALNIYAGFGVTLDEVERAYEKDIHVVCLGIPGEALTAAFETKDMFGNPSLDMSTTKFASIQSALPFIQVYNMLTGYGDCLNDENGEKTCLCNRFVAVTSPEQLLAITATDQNESNYVADYEFIDSCLGVNNSSLTGADITANIVEVLDKAMADLQ